jgi:hypothetical protein
VLRDGGPEHTVHGTDSHGPAEVISLSRNAAETGDESGLLGGLDALDNHMQREDLPMRTMVSRKDAAVESVAMVSTNILSILMVSTGRRRSSASDECPVPKSSMARETPRALRDVGRVGSPRSPHHGAGHSTSPKNPAGRGERR